jgi:hypothetical protein
MDLTTTTERWTSLGREELKQIKDFITTLESDAIDNDSTTAVITQWRAGALASIDRFLLDTEDHEAEAANGYKVFNIEATSGQRTYRAEIFLDNDFNDVAEAQVRRALDIMITRMVAGQVRNFIRYAEPEPTGLRSRRSRDAKFPVKLPYLSPRPTTIQDQIAEEAGIIEAAVFTAFSSTTQAAPVKAKIVRFYKRDSQVMGYAPTHRYYNQRSLYITLNEGKLDGDKRFDEKWAGIMAHEFLHNLGWEHPDGIYTLALPIEIYQACISSGHHLSEESIR